jgi:hypothetical protein
MPSLHLYRISAASIYHCVRAAKSYTENPQLQTQVHPRDTRCLSQRKAVIKPWRNCFVAFSLCLNE